MRFIPFFSGCLVCLVLFNDGNEAPATEAGDPVVVALRLVVARRVDVVRKWLDERDFKSLTQSAGGLRTLTALLQARSDDESWQAATQEVLDAAGDLSAAGRAVDAAGAAAALGKLERAVAAVQAQQPTGKPQSLPQPTGGLRPLMLLMDGIRGDAKIDLLSGNVEEVKKGAYVLSELGRVVSNSGSAGPASRQRWPELSSAFVEASLAAARSPTDDAVTLKQLMRNVSQRCDACHELR